MALLSLPGRGMYWPQPPDIGLPVSFATGAVIAATGEKIALVGQFWHKDRGPKDVAKLGFRFGAVTKAGGSGLTVSLQDVSLTAGPPGQPDETQDQTVAVANGNASFASNTWLQTGALSGNRTLTPGDLVAVVVEYDGGGRLGADSVVVSTVSQSANLHRPLVGLKTGGVWTFVGARPCVVLECTDGTFGTLGSSFPCSAVNSHAFKQDTAVADEHALEFRVPFNCVADGAWVALSPAANTADADVVLYDGVTALAAATLDANVISAAGVGRTFYADFPSEVALDYSRTYRLAVKPTQATSLVTAYSVDVATSGHFQCHDGGEGFQYTSRLDLGAWAAATATRRLVAGVRLSAVHDGRPVPALRRWGRGL